MKEPSPTSWAALLLHGLVLLLICSVAARAQVSATVAYQGYLSDAGNRPVDGTVTLDFALCAEATGNCTLMPPCSDWSEVGRPLSVNDGVFSVELGAETPIPACAWQQSPWLSITLNGIELQPRQSFSSVAYAQQARSVDLPDGVDMARFHDLVRFMDLLERKVDLLDSTAPQAASAIDAMSLDTIRISDANLQVTNGAGLSLSQNGRGNVVIGYDEPGSFTDPTDEEATAESVQKTGSHNLVIGPQHHYSGVGGFVAGRNNRIEGVTTSVLGGQGNWASGSEATIGGGQGNVASAAQAHVSGGQGNQASFSHSSVAGGEGNTARAAHATIAGGQDNVATAAHASVVGGTGNTTAGERSVVVGGSGNRADAANSVVLGGLAQTAAAVAAVELGKAGNLVRTAVIDTGVPGSGGARVTREDGDWIASLSELGAGRVTVFFQPGVFQSLPVCTLSIVMPLDVHCIVPTVTQNNASIECRHVGVFAAFVDSDGGVSNEVNGDWIDGNCSEDAAAPYRMHCRFSPEAVDDGERSTCLCTPRDRAINFASCHIFDLDADSFSFIRYSSNMTRPTVDTYVQCLKRDGGNFDEARIGIACTDSH